MFSNFSGHTPANISQRRMQFNCSSQTYQLEKSLLSWGEISEELEEGQVCSGSGYLSIWKEVEEEEILIPFHEFIWIFYHSTLVWCLEMGGVFSHPLVLHLLLSWLVGEFLALVSRDWGRRFCQFREVWQAILESLTWSTLLSTFC